MVFLMIIYCYLAEIVGKPEQTAPMGGKSEIYGEDYGNQR
jgi:hypothetical protein